MSPSSQTPAASSSLSMPPKLKVLLVSYVLASLLLQAHGCFCPSCGQVDNAERCMCCVYRQLGKRSGGSNSGPSQEPTSLEQTAMRNSPISSALRESPMATSAQRESPMSSVFGEYPVHVRDADASYFQALFGLRPFVSTQNQKQDNFYEVTNLDEMFQG